jgi:hypothetical protein
MWIKPILPLVLLVGIVFSGCSTTPPKGEGPIILNYSEKTIPMSSAKAWAGAIERHTKSRDFVLLVVHGGIKRGGGDEWWSTPDFPRIGMSQNEQAKALFNAFWPKPLWLVSCNEGGFDLTVPNVHYARRIVWSSPNDGLNWWRGFHYAGDPVEFVQFGKPVKLAGERQSFIPATDAQ